VLRALALVATVFLAAPAAAESASPAASRERAATAFEAFAREFMAKVRAHEQREKLRPRVAAGPGSPVVTYRGYGEEFRTELRESGSAAAPFVGLLHYTERVYSCRDLVSGECSVAASAPVTEVFRYRGGRWVY
jgi:hypothetical protein